MILDMNIFFGIARYRRFLINEKEVLESECMPLVMEKFGLKTE